MINGKQCTCSCAVQRCRERIRRARGFTLVELLVAIIAGLFVVMAAFAFAKTSTLSFQQESRIANAMLSNTLGFRRLVSDVQRASFLSTPNIRRDFARPHPIVPGQVVPGTICNDPATLPLGINNLQGLLIEHGLPASQNSDNQLTPDQLTLTGSYAGVEQYYVRNIETGSGAGPRIYLQPLSGAVRRTQSNSQVLAATEAEIWQRVFAPGRLVRLIDQSGYQHFGIIHAAGINGSGISGIPFIDLEAQPPLYFQGGAQSGNVNPACKGIAGKGIGMLVNVVNRIRYEVRSLKNVPRYASIYDDNNKLGSQVAIDADANRMELVRSEVALDGTVISDTEELIAEYAVDLRFGITVAATVNDSLGYPNPTLQRFDFGESDVYTWGGSVTTNTTQPGPERIRSVRLRLAIRSREPDRKTNLPAPAYSSPSPLASAGGIYRFKFPNNTYARVRTLQADVSLPNHAGLSWLPDLKNEYQSNEIAANAVVPLCLL
jgi:type II secretory pathway pseudopilin PulG